MIKKLGLKNVRDYKNANMFLKKEFLPYYMTKDLLTKNVESANNPLSNKVNLDFIFFKRFVRKVNFNNTIKFYGAIILIPHSNFRISFTKCVVDVYLLEDRGVYIIYKGDLIRKIKLSNNNEIYKLNKEIESFLSQREYQQVLV